MADLAKQFIQGVSGCRFHWRDEGPVRTCRRVLLRGLATPCHQQGW